MIRAYNEIYLSNVYRNLGSLFDIASNLEDMDIDQFAGLFSTSSVARGIESGSPRYLAGMSPQAMFEEITNRRIIGRMPPSRGSDAEWTGYIAAYSQWHCGCTFKEMFSAVSAARMMSLRDTTHGDAMGAVSIIIDTMNPVTVLKRLREERGISQSELALYSGVPIRSIRAYEQGTVDLCKAQGDTLYSLSRVLGCPVDVLIRG